MKRYIIFRQSGGTMGNSSVGRNFGNCTAKTGATDIIGGVTFRERRIRGALVTWGVRAAINCTAEQVRELLWKGYSAFEITGEMPTIEKALDMAEEACIPSYSANMVLSPAYLDCRFGIPAHEYEFENSMGRHRTSNDLRDEILFAKDSEEA